jgi:glycosyltransferase involved in cell wall biosynthesis
MRILLIDQHFAVPRLATSTFPFVLMSELVRRGHQVTVLTTDQGSGRGSWYETEESGIVVHWAKVPYSNHMRYMRRIMAFFQFAGRCIRYIHRLSPFDIVYAASSPLTVAFPGVYAARRWHCPMVFEVRDLWPEVPIALGALRDPLSIAAAKWLERFAYRNAAFVIARSPMMADGVVETGYPRERVRVVPNACDFRRFDVPAESGKSFRQENQWLADRPLVLYAGAFGLVNGCSYIVRLAAEVEKLVPEARFLLVGQGREEQMIRDLARELGVLDRTLFIRPPVPKNEVPRLFSAADITMSTVIDVPALHKNCANKFFDSLAAGRPIAINHEGWLADLIREHDCGLVLPARDIRQAGQMMAQALRNRDWLRQAGRRAYQLGRKQFDALRCVDEVEAVLYAAIGDQEIEQHRAAA